jgi:hypothetical protein
MRVEIRMQNVDTQWGSGVLVTWNIPIIEEMLDTNALYLELHYDELSVEAQDLVQRLSDYAEELEPTVDGMPAGVLLEHIAKQVRERWSLGPRGYHLVEPGSVEPLRASTIYPCIQDNGIDIVEL